MDYQQEKRDSVMRYAMNDAFAVLREKYGDKYAVYREEWAESSKRQIKTERPMQLSLELTSWCNLSCKMCYRNYLADKTRKYICLDTVKKVVDEARELKIPGIWLGLMTEGLLHPNAKEIIKMFGTVGAMDYWFITNGTLLTTDIAEAMIDAHVTILTVSLDSSTPGTYKAIRGADLAHTTKNIMEFLELREKRNSSLPRLRVSFVEMESNTHEKEAFIEQWRDKADLIDFQAMGDTSLLNDGVRQDAFLNSDFHCGSPFNRILVKYDGELWPCCGYYTDTVKQNISECTLMEFWNSEQMERLRDSLIKKEFLSVCEYCTDLLSSAK